MCYKKYVQFKTYLLSPKPMQGPELRAIEGLPQKMSKFLLSKVYSLIGRIKNSTPTAIITKMHITWLRVFSFTLFVQALYPNFNCEPIAQSTKMQEKSTKETQRKQHNK